MGNFVEELSETVKFVGKTIVLWTIKDLTENYFDWNVGKGPYKIGRQFARTLFERLEHHPRTHPYKRTSVIKVSDGISEMYLSL